MEARRRDASDPGGSGSVASGNMGKNDARTCGRWLSLVAAPKARDSAPARLHGRSSIDGSEEARGLSKEQGKQADPGGMEILSGLGLTERLAEGPGQGLLGHVGMENSHSWSDSMSCSWGP